MGASGCDKDAKRGVWTDIWAVFTNPVFVWGYAKVLLASATSSA